MMRVLYPPQSAGIHLGAQAADKARTYTLELLGEAGGSLIGTWTADLTLAATLCRGEGRAIDATITAEWVGDPATVPPVIRLTISPADLADLDSFGLYYLKVWTDQDEDLLPPGSTVEILPPAGELDPPRTYCSLDDVRDVCPWIERAINAHPTAQIDLAEQRGQAAEWIDATATARYRIALEEWFRLGSKPVSLESTDTHTEAVFAALSAANPVNTLLLNLRASLGLDGLQIDPEIDSSVRRAAAYYTAYLVLDPLRFAPAEGNEYAELARKYVLDAKILLSGSALRIDTDDDGFADVTLR